MVKRNPYGRIQIIALDRIPVQAVVLIQDGRGFEAVLFEQAARLR
jgi:hypothetical protein